MDTEKTENNLDAIIENVRCFTLSAVSDARYKHSMRTAKMAEKLCARYGLDCKGGYLAGIGHDMCKDMEKNVLLSLACKDGKLISAWERDKPSLLHGRAAAVKMHDDFGVTDKDVLEAVSCHTFGGAGICPLAKVIYVADKVEPGREYITKKYIQKLLCMSLDALTKVVIKDSIAYLEKKGRMVSPETLLFYKSLEGEGE